MNELQIFNAVTSNQVPPEIQQRATLLCELRGFHPWEPMLVKGWSMLRWQAAAAELMLLSA